MKRTGTWETVTTIICFSILTAYMHNYWLLLAMAAGVLLFIGFSGE